MSITHRFGAFYERYTTPPRAPESNRQHLVRKLVRRVHWARTEGIGRIIEEDRLDPRQRVRTAIGKARWRRAHPRPAGLAVPIYVVGLQRSGTNMLMRGLDEAPEIEVRNENDRTVFERHRIRSSAQLRSTIAASRQQFVFVKPICDSHRVDELLELDGVAPGRAVWVYRDVDARARSEVSKFGPANLLALRDIAAGHGETRWQGERLPGIPSSWCPASISRRWTRTRPPRCSGWCATGCSSTLASRGAVTCCSSRTTSSPPTRRGTCAGCVTLSAWVTATRCARTSTTGCRMAAAGWTSTLGCGPSPTPWVRDWTPRGSLRTRASWRLMPSAPPAYRVLIEAWMELCSDRPSLPRRGDARRARLLRRPGGRMYLWLASHPLDFDEHHGADHREPQRAEHRLDVGAGGGDGKPARDQVRLVAL